MVVFAELNYFILNTILIEFYLILNRKIHLIENYYIFLM